MPFKLPNLNDLNKTQQLIINLMNKTDKLAVIGGPGTGKTVIAILAATQFASSNNKCLILSYSISLKDQIKCITKLSKQKQQQNVKDIDIVNKKYDNIEVNTYLKWFWHQLIELGFTEDDIKTKLQTKAFVYDLNKLDDALSKIPAEKKLKYEYIFIDEAQDVQSGLIKYFKQFCKKILVTFDDCQKVGNENEKKSDAILNYDHSNILVDLNIGDKYFDLIDNYRNTVQIEKCARLLLSSYDFNDVTLKKVTSNRLGEEVKLVKSDDKMTYQKMAKYIVEHYDRSKSLAVLFDSTTSNRNLIYSKLKEAINIEIAKSGIQTKLLYKYGEYGNINSKNSLDNAIFLMSFKTSKGLEFDDVFTITTNVNISSNYQIRNSFYVALTRAKSNAYILIDDSSKESQEINKLFLNNSHLFEVENI